MPDGSSVNVTPVGGVPCLGNPTTSVDDPLHPGGRGYCAGTPGIIDSVLVPYTLKPGDIDINGKVTFSTALTGAYAHITVADLAGVSGSTPISLTVAKCNDGEFCDGLETCDPTLMWGEFNERLGGCVPGERPCVDNLFCADVACNEATNQCDTTDTSTIVCPDNLFCADVACNEATNQCDTTDTSSIVCPDNLFCADVACNEATNQCDTTDTSTIVCPDDLFCADVACNEATDSCDTTDTSTIVCPDDLFCADVACNEDTDSCDTTDISETQCPDTECTYCDEDTDACEDNGLCGGCLTRTPGFWCAHDSVTDLFLPVTSCGIELNNTSVCTAGSAVEDLGFSNVDAKKNNTSPQQLQLIRQCAAAALNFAATIDGGSTCDDVMVPCWNSDMKVWEECRIADIYAECCDNLTNDSWCERGACGNDISNSKCIEMIDYFNNLNGDYDTMNCDSEPPAPYPFCPSLGYNGYSATPKDCDGATGNGCVNSGRALGAPKCK
jgi:hypothetical protein